MYVYTHASVEYVDIKTRQNKYIVVSCEVKNKQHAARLQVYTTATVSY